MDESGITDAGGIMDAGVMTDAGGITDAGAISDRSRNRNGTPRWKSKRPHICQLPICEIRGRVRTRPGSDHRSPRRTDCGGHVPRPFSRGVDDGCHRDGGSDGTPVHTTRCFLYEDGPTVEEVAEPADRKRSKDPNKGSDE